MLVILSSFPLTLHAELVRILSNSCTPRAGVSQDMPFSYTETNPGAILCPNKDARARSDRLQLGTAHIQSFTQTRQVSVVMGMTGFGASCYRLLASAVHAQGAAATDRLRLASSSVQTDPTAQS